MVTILMMSAKMVTLGLPEMKVFYDIINYVHDVSTKFYGRLILYCKFGYIANILLTLAFL